MTLYLLDTLLSVLGFDVGCRQPRSAVSLFSFDTVYPPLQDLPRTFPGHPWLDTPEGHAALRRVLVGYSFRDSDVGYCQVHTISCFHIHCAFCNLNQCCFFLLLLLQGLNYVAALLLLVMKTEEDAFWMLAVLLENVLVRDCYTTNLSGCHVEQRVFKDLLAQKCPR